MERETGRGQVVLTALVPVMAGMLGPLSGTAGRLAWLAPVLALPVGLALSWAWRGFGARTLPEMLGESFGHWGGKVAQILYIMWGHILLTESARRYARRLLTLTAGENARWLYLGVGLAFALWLGRDSGVLLRSGRLFFGAIAAALAVTAAVSLLDADWKNLYPPGGADWAGLPAGVLLVTALAGYGVFGLCLPQGEKAERWTLVGCGVMAGLPAVTLGAFGPALTERLEEPFLLLLEGGGAVLTAVLALADLVLFAFLARGCGAMWEGAFHAKGKWGEVLVEAWALLGAGLFPTGEIGEDVFLVGGLLMGIGVPVVVVFTKKVTKRGGKAAIYCGSEREKLANVEREEEITKSRKKDGKRS